MENKVKGGGVHERKYKEEERSKEFLAYLKKHLYTFAQYIHVHIYMHIKHQKTGKFGHCGCGRQ